MGWKGIGPVAIGTLMVAALPLTTRAANTTVGTCIQQPASLAADMTGGGELLSATIVSPTLAFAVGWYLVKIEPPQPPNLYKFGGSLIEEWNGGSSWSVVGTGGPNVMLRAVTTVNSSNVWAVGSISNGTTTHAMVTQWKGSTWNRTVLPLPAGSTGAALWYVSAKSPSDVWASGYYEAGQEEYSLVEHYNGRVWRQISVPSSVSGITAVLDLGRKDVLALDEEGALFEYNGQAWNEASSQPPDFPVTLVGSSPDDVWTVSGGNGPGGVPEHWNGSAWSQIGTSEPNVYLLDNAEASPTTLWTAGYTEVSTTWEPYVEENGTAATIQPVAGNAFLFGDAASGSIAFSVGFSQVGNDPPAALVESCVA